METALAWLQDLSLRSVIVIFCALSLHVLPVVALDASRDPAAAETGSANVDTLGSPSSILSLTGIIPVSTWIWGKSTIVPGTG